MTSTLHVGIGLVAVVLLAPPTSIAQSSPPPPPNVAAPHPSPDPQAAIKSAPITLTGCLERSKPASAPKDTADRSIHTNPPTAYRLRAESGTGAADTAVVYNVIAAGADVRFEEHKGHRVEVTGTMRAATHSQAGLSNHGVSPSTPSGSTGMETTPTPDPIAAGRADGVSVSQPILVDSLKMLDGGCKNSTE